MPYPIKARPKRHRKHGTCGAGIQISSFSSARSRNYGEIVVVIKSRISSADRATESSRVTAFRVNAHQSDGRGMAGRPCLYSSRALFRQSGIGCCREIAMSTFRRSFARRRLAIRRFVSSLFQRRRQYRSVIMVDKNKQGGVTENSRSK